MGEGRDRDDDSTSHVRVLVVDDHLVVRKGIRHLLASADARCEVTAEAATVAAARAALEHEPVDVALIDVVLPDGDGIQLCREIRSTHPAVACLVLTSYADDRALMAAAMAGAAGYLVKDAGASDLVARVVAAARGERLLDDESVRAALERVRRQDADQAGLGQLTPQERRVFELVGQGLSNRQIAEQLYVTEKTVKNYVSRVLTKLHMDRRTEMAVLSARLGERRATARSRRRPPEARSD